jgi:hypothetical protein
LWQQFLRLKGQPDQKIIEFGKWGPLYKQLADGVEEEISDWRDMIDQLNTISDAAARLAGRRDGKDPWPLLIRYLYGEKPSWIDDACKRFPDFRRLMIAAAIDKLFSRCPTHGCIAIIAERMHIQPVAEGLGATVLLQFAQVLTRRDGEVLCSGCGKRIDPSKAKTGRRRYCQKCRKKGMPERHAAHDYRDRRKGAKEKETISS